MKKMLFLAAATATLLTTLSAAHAGILISPAPTIWGSGHSSSVYVDDGTYVVGFTNDAAMANGTWGVAGTLDGDPNIETIERVVNNTGSALTTFTVSVTPADGMSTISNLVGLLPPDGSTTVFTAVSPAVFYGAGESITFSGGTLAPGASAKLDFTFDLDSSVPSFNYAIANNPTPEPASLGVLALAGLMMVKRRRSL